jgi:small GTP-binding protein
MAEEIEIKVANLTPRIKVVFAGEGGTGKTSIIKAIDQRPFDSSERLTVGIDFQILCFVDANNTQRRTAIWDLGGQTQFKFIASATAMGCNILVFVFDFERYQTWLALTEWRDLLKDAVTPDVRVILVGNKPSDDDIAAMKVDLGAEEYFAISAKEGTGVEDIKWHLFKLLESF